MTTTWRQNLELQEWYAAWRQKKDKNSAQISLYKLRHIARYFILPSAKAWTAGWRTPFQAPSHHRAFDIVNQQDYQWLIRTIFLSPCRCDVTDMLHLHATVITMVQTNNHRIHCAFQIHRPSWRSIRHGHRLRHKQSHWDVKCSVHCATSILCMPKSHSALRFVMFIFTHKSSALRKMAQCVFIVNYDALALLVVKTRSAINGSPVNNEEIK